VAELIGWRYAFLLLAPGPLIGVVASSALRPRQRHRIPEEEQHDHQLYAHDTVCRSGSAALARCR
jgi:predicted MFS family arabinose efflux permease